MNTLHREKAFTLIELLVVIAIIGVLAAVVLSSLNSARAKAKEARVVSTVKNMQSQLALYYSDYGSYSTNAHSTIVFTSRNIAGTFGANGEDRMISALSDLEFAKMAENFIPSVTIHTDIGIEEFGYAISPSDLKKIENADIAVAAVLQQQTGAEITFGNNGQSYTIVKTFKKDGLGYHTYCVDGKGNIVKKITSSLDSDLLYEYTLEYDQDFGDVLWTDIWCKK
jgi:prepilin-type N-terminal cleavage/methylation domain-containing protein